MKKLNSQGMKVLKTCHLLLAMSWAVGIIAMTLLFTLEPASGDELYMTLHIIHFLDFNLVVPGALLTILVGIIYGAFTNWGFFKQRWIIVKWIVSILIIVVGSFCFSPNLEPALEIVSRTRDMALHDPTVMAYLSKAYSISICESVAAIALVVISVFKPWKKKATK